MQYKGWWEFPGGKIEEGETPQQALVREIKEELDTEIRVGELIDTIEYDYPTFHLSMDCFWAKIVAGNLELIQAAAAKWLTKETLDSEHSRFTFDELINEMIADAWYMVTEYHLRLGPLGITDNLEEVVKYIFETYPFPFSEKRDKIIRFLETTEDKTIRKYKADLTLNVPYRLQVPFRYGGTLSESVSETDI